MKHQPSISVLKGNHPSRSCCQGKAEKLNCFSKNKTKQKTKLVQREDVTLQDCHSRPQTDVDCFKKSKNTFFPLNVSLSRIGSCHCIWKAKINCPCLTRVPFCSSSDAVHSVLHVGKQNPISKIHSCKVLSVQISFKCNN